MTAVIAPATDEWVAVLDVFVAGSAAPQGSKRHVGRGVMVESSKAVKPWREDVRQTCLAAWDDLPLDEPVRLRIEFVRRRPTSAPKNRTPSATTKPDLDKLARAVMDAIGSAGVWVDDARVTELACVKRVAEIGEVPGARITIATRSHPPRETLRGP